MTTDTASVRATIVLGTRPEIIKLAPIIRTLDERSIPFSLIHTGQHYSENLDAVFFDQLELPAPDHNLQIGSKSHGQQTGEMLAAIEKILLEERPDVVIVQGDTNSTLAGAIATCKLDCELTHVEAGLRSDDREMPEELNRIMADHVTDHLFPPTEMAHDRLLEEGIPDERITVTGNTVVDALYDHQVLAAEHSTALDDLDLEPGSFALLTAHRAENVDDADRFADILAGVNEFATAAGIDVIYPIHPRATEQLDEFELAVPERIRLVEPLEYFDFLRLETDARIVFTDSGGVQEESCILGVPCVTVRTTTERSETVAVGANRCVGTDPAAIVAAGTELLDADGEWDNPFGDGTAADQIVDTLFEESQ